MRRLTLALFLSALFCGCGSDNSPGIATERFRFDNADGNFVSTTVEVERRYLYTYNQQEQTISGFVAAEKEDEDVHHQAVEEVELQLEELDGSPFSIVTNPVLGLATAREDKFLVVLENDGTLSSYTIDGLAGTLTLSNRRQTSVQQIRRLVSSKNQVAVLGDNLQIFELLENGEFGPPAVLGDTVNWSDVELSDNTAIASTPGGVSGFVFSPGQSVNQTFSVNLPGNSRGDVARLEDSFFVLNPSDNSLSTIDQDGDGSLSSPTTFALPLGLSNPTLITANESSQSLVVADLNSAHRLSLVGNSLDVLGEVALGRAPSELFSLPELPVVLIGHLFGIGSSILELGEDGVELHPESGPGGNGATLFALARRVERITVRQDL